MKNAASMMPPAGSALQKANPGEARLALDAVKERDSSAELLDLEDSVLLAESTKQLSEQRQSSR